MILGGKNISHSVCVCREQTEIDPDEMRREMEQQLEVWHKLPLGTPEEVRV